MSTTRDFRNYKVWEKAHAFTLNIYDITSNFPSDEKYGLISQLRRASSSVPTNFAEGCGHRSQKEFARFIQIAIASSSEVEYLLELSKDLKLIKKDRYSELTEQVVEIRKMLISLSEKVRL